MKTLSVCIWVALMGLLVGCNRVCCEDIKDIVVEGAQLKLISDEFKFTEGPIADKQGNVYFTDQPNDRIMLYTVKGEMKTFMQPSGRSNGLYFDRQWNLIACADEKTELWRIDIKTKKHEVLAKEYNGKSLNSTNDVWVRPDGGMYITDPFYKRPWWDYDQKPQDKECVYFLSKKGELKRVVDDLAQPNGIIGTPDGKKVYIADIKGNKTWSWRIMPDGTLVDKNLFCEMGSDGMTLDCCGNVYLTGSKGVTVFGPDGKKLTLIEVPKSWTANVTFGGPEMKTLFITAQTALYTIEMNVCGAR